MRKRTLARECVLKLLYQVDLIEEETQKLADLFWEDNPVDSEVRSFADTLFWGVHEKREELDAIIKRHTENWDMKRMAYIDKNILRLGTYELLFMPDIPPKVAINEAVNIAKKYSQEDSGKFVNGVLDHINHSERKVNS